MPNPLKGGGGLNPFKKKFWKSNNLSSGSNILTGGVRNLVGSAFTHGGGSLGDTIYKPYSPGGKGEIEDANKKAMAAAEAQARQAEFEAAKAAGIERLALKRRKGYGASMVVTPTLGGASTMGS
ncbi:MAG: hypothetical protein M0T69_02010 [Deltaproteobacteria bacterium]|nr:hypothetical protein [Deltaproteobacteria bacterium]